MELIRVTAPPIEPVTLAELKAHAKIEFSDDDALITSLGQAARETIEIATRRAIIEQQWDLKIDCFPGAGKQFIPRPPLRSIDSITYLDTAGASQTLAASIYTVVAPSGDTAPRGYFHIAPDQVWPTTQSTFNAVTIRFTAGYPPTGSPTDYVANVPAGLKTAIKYLVTHWCDQRAPVVDPAGAALVLPFAVKNLIWNFKALEF